MIDILGIAAIVTIIILFVDDVAEGQLHGKDS